MIYNIDDDITQVFVERKDGTQIYPSDTKTLQDIVKNDLSKGKIYLENMVEVTTSGQYISGTDGSKITIYPGERKTYIYYKEQ